MNEFRFEFHIARLSREKYKFDESIFHTDGNAIIGSFHTARLLSSKINEKRDLLNFPEKAAKSSEIYAIGLMDEFFHFIIKQYRSKFSFNILENALQQLTSDLSTDEVENVIRLFLLEFPPIAVHKKEIVLSDYISELKKTQQFSNILEEIILLWVENQNPALDNYSDLFSDKLLTTNSAYKKFVESLYKYFSNHPSFGLENENIIDLLLAPSRAVPNSILGQLEFIKNRWGALLGDLIYKLLGGLDFLNEESKAIFFGPGPILIPKYDQTWDQDHEKFTPDKDWMPSLVLIAKNAFVWLDQLSKKYNREINRLDLIPDEELSSLNSRGFTGLWLIGLWERSKASESIKKLCGNPEALASAYSLSNYQIAQELGGELSYLNLKERAWKWGIRLASDMVPNHMGIDSSWVYDHPDWFVNLEYSPFPSYSFNGPNLSQNQNIEIKIEDHYFDRSDAAVVFKYHNYENGLTRFIYHGNDGTTMPWNDTAQLNYLLPEVREAVYQTILSVAKRFPIIRFDAAMTLAKKHYQRLWFPEPGTGGAIPSRAEFGLTKDQFEKILPNEFWREVVDRLSIDAPDTLLLAEAFWLMESYFVRTLGMHRVYNSAFMNMLRNEDNANYRKLIKNTLEFDPQILKRFVNFMNNPDEKTAAEQFGKGDKYFGICTIMATLPGLPMFGHGQVEGYAEKYGMEFKKAYWEEKDDEYLIKRHENQIFPILHRRKIFSEVDNFYFYDFINPESGINEDVFVYSNYSDGQASLVIYHNKYAETQGWINTSDTVNIEFSNERNDTNINIFTALRLNPNHDFVIFKDLSSNLEFIRSIPELRSGGLFLNLHAYQSLVFVNFQSINDDQWGSYRQIYAYLNGQGVPNIEEALKELLLQPVQRPIKEILNRGFFDYLQNNKLEVKDKFSNSTVVLETKRKLENLADGIFAFTGNPVVREETILEICQMLDFALLFPKIETRFPNPTSKLYVKAIEDIHSRIVNEPNFWETILSYVFLHRLGGFSSPNSISFQSQSYYSEWRLVNVLKEMFTQYQIDENGQQFLSNTIYVILGFKDWYKEIKNEGLLPSMKKLLSKPEIQQYLLINRYQGVLWFNKERFDALIFWLFITNILEIGFDSKISSSKFIEDFLRMNKIFLKLESAVKLSEFNLDNLLKILDKETDNQK